MAMRRATTAPTPLLTVAEFAKMPESHGRYELIKGKLVEKALPKWKHGEIARRLLKMYDAFDPDEDLGEMNIEINFELRDDYSPIPDLLYYRNGRVPDWNESMPPAPDFAIEIQSPGQTVGELTDKANDYIAGGVAVVWVIYPDKETAHLFCPGLVSPEIVTLAGELEAESVIPGFKVPMIKLFKTSK